MRFWWLPQTGSFFDRPGDGASQRSGGAASARSPYSPQYETIVAQGHERPTPSFGAPALIWHVAVWPRRRTDDGADCDPNDTAGMSDSKKAKALFEARRKQWHADVNAVLEGLQNKSSLRPGQVAGSKSFTPIFPHELDRASAAGGGYVTPLEVLERDAFAFTLWWADADDADPAGNAIRVRVHAELNADYACISFYMDIDRRWDDGQGASTHTGTRRLEFQAAADKVRDICEHQFVPGPNEAVAPVDLPPVPEKLHSADKRTEDELDRALRDARNLLYVEAWEAFCADFDFGLDKIAGTRSEVFANFRGLVLATDGMRVGGAGTSPDAASFGTRTFPNFSADPRFNIDGVEANAVVKAFWPFVRRITPRADYREFIACGVLNWRAIYITALGSSSQYIRGEERAATDAGTGEALIRVPPHLLPPEEQSQAAAGKTGLFDQLVRKRESGRGGNNHPVRYLLLTKHQPHPRQIGRIAERINAMGTLRLFALKDWAAVRNADPYIRILGQDLDQITESWSGDKNLINTVQTSADIRAARADIERMERRDTRGLSCIWTVPELKRLKEILPSYVPRNPANWAYKLVQRIRFYVQGRRPEYFQLVRQLDEDLAGDVRHSALYHISSKVETRLLEISARLDELGKLTVGGLHFRLGRAAYYVRAFEILLGTLQVTNIPTWVSYEQFVRRGLAPAFDYMASVGQRLRAVRERLLSVTEMIETSALVGQAAATRHNTAVLRQTTTLAIILLTLYVTRSLIWNVAGLALRPVYRVVPPQWRELIDQFLLMFKG